MLRILEIACFSLESCLIAQSAGANRIEFCNDYKAGGITPPLSEIRKASSQLQIPMVVMIRPRPGDFIYTSKEKEKMLGTIKACCELSVEGVVFGALLKSGEIDTDLCNKVRAANNQMSITFHRAIDQCSDLDQSFASLIDCKIDRVLTSGGKGTAIENLSRLKTLQLYYGQQIKILPGGGIRSENCKKILDETGCNELHTSAISDHEFLPNKEEIRSILRLVT